MSDRSKRIARDTLRGAVISAGVISGICALSCGTLSHLSIFNGRELLLELPLLGAAAKGALIGLPIGAFAGFIVGGLVAFLGSISRP
jgi:hypothetical protein